jgi:FKBP-type peptidyl-prolyl cis-trans isomerase
MSRSRSPTAPASALCVALATSWLAGCSREGAPLSTRTLASGLRIDELRAGTGEAAADGDWVEVEYDGHVVAPGGEGDAPPGANGGAPATPFDSTRSGEPFVFRIGRSKVLAAFSEGVAGMREGGLRRLTLTAALAYGSLGKGPVPPDAALEYEVELLHRFARSQSGVDYQERKRGTGPKPAVGQRVFVRCRAWLVETARSILDPKRSREGYEFEVGSGAAIPALDKVLPEMNVGSIWRLGVPPELGYGQNGRIPILAPGQDLLLDVELIAIRNKP